VGPDGPTDKENQVNLYKKYCFRYVTSLKRQGSGSVSNSRIRIRLEIRIRIKVKSRIRICIKRVQIRNTASAREKNGCCAILKSIVILGVFVHSPTFKITMRVLIFIFVIFSSCVPEFTSVRFVKNINNKYFLTADISVDLFGLFSNSL
jgi:hypothetical protein